MSWTEKPGFKPSSQHPLSEFLTFCATASSLTEQGCEEISRFNGAFLTLKGRGAQATEERRILREREEEKEREEGCFGIMSGPEWDRVMGGGWEGREPFTGTVNKQGLRI